MSRKGEAERFAPYESYANRTLLWHGSAVSNFPGILSQGLRIAPPEAPATGYMFGKGVYFADAISKSLNYARPAPVNVWNPWGQQRHEEEEGFQLLLLCEVALGTMCGLLQAEYM